MAIKNDRSKAAFARAQTLFPGGVNSPVRAFKSVGGEPLVMARGEGPYIFDVDGNRYVDYVLSWGPLAIGHAHPAVVESIRKQAGNGTSFGACSEEEAELAELVMKLVPSIEMIRFVNSGTEAGMSAIRLARAFTNRSKIVKFAGCYHGHVDSLLVQAGSGVATLGLPDCAGVPQGFTGDTLTAPYNDLDAVRTLFERFPDEIAAVIVEPIIGNAGLIVPEDGYLAGLSEMCGSRGALFIMDEVMTGFRAHPGGAQALYGVKPDLCMLGKVIGGGLPVGAFGGRRDIMQLLAPLGPVYQAGTLSGNPLAMAAGAATLREWTRGGSFEVAANAAETIVAALSDAAADKGIPLTASSVGSMFGFFFQEGPVRNYEEAKRSDTERFKRFFRSSLDHGIYFAPSQFEAAFTSSVHGGAALDHTLEAIRRVFASLS